MIKKLCDLFKSKKVTYEDLPRLWQQQAAEILKNDSELTYSHRVILEDLIECLRISTYDPDGIDLLKDKLTEYFNGDIKKIHVIP